MLTLEETIQLILKNRTDLDRKAVMEMIEQKRQQMGPELVNEESAAMIVARDLGIDLHQITARPRMKIEDITEGSRSVTLTAKVVGVDTVREFSRSGGGTGRVASITVADDTGRIRVVLWDETTRLVSDGLVTVGSWVQIRNAYVKQGLRGALELNIGRMGGIRALEDYEIEELDIEVADAETVKLGELRENMYDVVVVFAVQRVFGLSTFTRKSDGSEGKVLSLIGADETGSARIVFWDDQAEQMRDVEEGEVIRLSGAYTRKGRYGDIEVHAGRSSRIDRGLDQKIEAVETPSAKFQEMGLQPIKSLSIEMRDVDIEGKVLKIFPATTFQRENGEGRVQNILVTDGTGTVRVTFWNDDVDKVKDLHEGDIIRIRHGYIKEGFRGGVDFQVGRRAEIEINPRGTGLENLDLSQVDLVPTTLGNRVQIAKIDESMEGKSVEISGLIMTVSRRSPIYAACPNCKKKVEEDAQGYTCPVCGPVPQPEYRMLYKVTIDDGTSSIPVTLFGQTAEELLGMTAAEAHELITRSGKESEPFDRNSHRMLGVRVAVRGRVTRFRDSLEIAASSLAFPDIIREIERERERIGQLMR